MLTKFLRLFAPPVFDDDEDKTRLARILNTLLLSLIIGLLVVGLVSRFDRLQNYLLALILTVGTWLIMRRGHIQVASMVITGGISILLTIVVPVTGGVRASTYGGFIVVILLAGFLLGQRASVIVALFGSILGACLLGIEKLGLGEIPESTASDLTYWIVFTVYFFVSATVLSLAVRLTEEGFQRSKTELAERMRTSEQLDRQVFELSTLHSVALATAEVQDEDKLLNRVVEIIHKRLFPDHFGILLWDPDTNLLQRHPSGYGAPPEFLNATFALGEGIVGSVFASGQARRVHDVRQASDYIPGRKEIQSELCVPIKTSNHIIGVINVESIKLDAFSEADEKLLTTIASQLAIAIENVRSLSSLQLELAERIRIEGERTKLIKELEDRNAELTRFNYTVSHELKNPLVTIKGFIGSVQKDLATGNTERARKDLNRVSTATDRMYETLLDLLQLSQVGRIVNSPAEVDLNKVISDAMETVSGQLHGKNIAIHVTPELPSIYADHARIREVFENLISNAVKYMGDQAEPLIEIGKQVKNNELVLFVKNNGIGIDPQYHDRIFNLFEKLDPNSEGTGVGLTLVKSIIELHGGRIWVESEGLGKGSTFCFTLPSSSQIQ